MHHLFVPLRDYLVLGEAGGAARAPRHHVRALVQPAALVAHLQEPPDGVVVLVRHGVVRVVPVHPVAEPDRLLRDDVGEAAHALLARLHEPVDAVLLYVSLGAEAHLLLHLNLHPKALAVVAVLVTLAEALHGLVSLEQVLVRATPGVVNAHRVVGRDGPVDERPSPLRVSIALQVLPHHAGGVPPLQQVTLHCREVHS